MSDACVVCLVEFDVSPESSTESATLPAPPESERLAVALLPECGHHLHDSCVDEWAEHSNTCPICRRVFNLVKVLDKFGGTPVSEYTVKNKRQREEFDAEEWARQNPEEEEEEAEPQEEDTPCPVCGLDDNEDVLLLCDRCDGAYHTYCVGLDHVPAGLWHCPACMARQRGSRAMARRQSEVDRIRTYLNSQRVQGMRDERRRRARNNRPAPRQPTPPSNGVHAGMPSIWGRQDDEESMANFRRHQNRLSEERREQNEWRQSLTDANRRMHESDRRPMANQPNREVMATRDADPVPYRLVSQAARETANAGFGSATNRRASVAPARSATASPAQTRAWGDLERARHVEATGAGGRKRRAESSNESSDEREEPERKLKRPRTRAVLDGASPSAGPSSHQTPNRPTVAPTEQPSFLASLLREVETPTIDTVSSYSSYASSSTMVRDRYSSPSTYHSSPAESVSPSSSRSQSPRPFSPSPTPQASRRRESAVPSSSRGRPSQAGAPRRSDSHGVSPTRAVMPLEAKEKVNKMVKLALTPHWKAAKLTSEQYATINRDISRKMYDYVADDYAAIDRNLDNWEKLAALEVAMAVKDLV